VYFKQLIFIILIVFGGFSCSENIPYVNDDGSKLVFVCNLEAGISPSAMLITTSDFTGQTTPEYPTDGNISITRIPKDSALKFEYIEDGYYINGQEDYFLTNEYYKITGFLESDVMNVISTVSPVKIVKEFKHGSVQTADNQTKNNEDKSIELSIDFPVKLSESEYNLQLDFDFYTKSIEILNGVEVVTENDVLIKPTISDYNNLVSKYHLLKHKPGYLLNISDLETDQIKLRLKIEDYTLAENEYLDRILFRMSTLSNENYNYNLFVSKLADTDVSNPVTLYTNIKNGYGVLSSSFTRETEIKVN
jgi:hypothetical protein